MPKINRYKIVNFKYGTSGNRLLSDKTINLYGDHVQLEATNSVGKSMSIQTLIQAICPLADVNKKVIDIYNVKEPIYTLIEWLLDDNKTLLLTGIGFERSTSTESEEGIKDKKNNLYKYFTFVIEDTPELEFDIDTFPLHEVNSKGNKVLRSLASTEKLVKDLNPILKDKVNTYSQNSYGQAKYKEKLAEYGIFQSEWKDIIIKLNGGEAVLSSFFEQYDNTEKFIKNKVLPLIDSNLNKNDSESTIKELRTQVRKFIDDIVKMNDKIQSYNEYKELLDYISQMYETSLKLSELDLDMNKIKKDLSAMYYYCENKNALLKESLNGKEVELDILKDNLNTVYYEEDSFEYHKELLILTKIREYLLEIDSDLNEVEININKKQQDVDIIKYQQNNIKLKEEKEYIIKKESEKEILSLKNSEISKKINDLGYSIKNIATNELKLINDNILNTKNDIKETNERIAKINTINSTNNKELIDLRSLNGSRKNEIDKHNSILENFTSKSPDFNKYILNNLMGTDINFEGYINDNSSEVKLMESKVISNHEKTAGIESEIENLKNNEFELKQEVTSTTNLIDISAKKLENIKNFETTLNNISYEFELDLNVNSSEEITNIVNSKVNEIEQLKKSLLTSEIKFKNELDNIKNITNVSVDEGLLDELEKLGIESFVGFKYLMELEIDIDKKIEMINKCPILPYSILLSKSDFEKLKKSSINYKTKFTTPILVRETYDNLDIVIENNIVSTNNLNLLTSFDANLLDLIKRNKIIDDLTTKISSIDKDIIFKDNQVSKLKELKIELSINNYNKSDLTKLGLDIETLTDKLTDLSKKIKKKVGKINQLKIDKENLLEENKHLSLKVNDKNKLIDNIKNIYEEHKLILNKQELIDTDNKRVKDLNNINSENNKDLEDNREYLTKININLNNLVQKHDYFNKLIISYSIYTKGETISGILDELLIIFDNFKNTSTAKEIKDLDDDIIKAKKREIDVETEMLKIKNNIIIEDILNTIVVGSITDIEQELSKIKFKEKELLTVKGKEVIKEGKQEGIIETKAKSINKKYSMEPADIDTILNIDFNNRRTDIKDEKLSIEDDIKDTNNTISKLENLVKDLQRYKGSSTIIVDFDDVDVRTTTDKLKLSLEEFNCNQLKLSNINNKIYMDLLKYNIDKNDKYKAIIENMNTNGDGYNNQIKRFEKVQTYIEEQILHVQGYNERLEAEKLTISRQIKDYLKDCIDEIAILNKLGKQNGEIIFNIKLPNEDDIHYSIIDDIVNEICEEKNVNSIDLTINSFYLLNRLINISSLKIKVMKYELNNKKELINWNKIITTTSGGQRFCISFIVLTLLMEYKRYNSRSVLRSKKTGKVLVMDNPFGETSEADFLKLVFELANNFMVQIISYTHVTNISIREQFNKIYKMTVETTASNKEFVSIIEDKNVATEEYVNTAKYFIGAKEKQTNLFDEII